MPEPYNYGKERMEMQSKKRNIRGLIQQVGDGSSVLLFFVRVFLASLFMVGIVQFFYFIATKRWMEFEWSAGVMVGFCVFFAIMIGLPASREPK